MTSMSVKPPRLPEELPALKPSEPLRDGESFSGCRMEHCVLTGEARGLGLTCAVLRNVRFAGALPAAEFEDAVFDCCDFSNVDLHDAVLWRAVFRNCRMTGVNFSGASLKDIRMENCVLPYANFHFGRMERAAFCECNCENADFAEAVLKAAEFSRSNLRRVQMSGTPLAGIDFTSCEIDGLGARPEDLRGCVFTAEQAVCAAKILGVTIRF